MTQLYVSTSKLGFFFVVSDGCWWWCCGGAVGIVVESCVAAVVEDPVYEDLTDVVFIVEGQPIRCHYCIIAVRYYLTNQRTRERKREREREKSEEEEDR